MHQPYRHYASSLRPGWVVIKAVSEFLGHGDPGFVLRTCTHPMASAPDRGREAVAAARELRRAADDLVTAQGGAMTCLDWTDSRNLGTARELLTRTRGGPHRRRTDRAAGRTAGLRGRRARTVCDD